jgi:anaerobic magnesium-protoporphyrin IX monomethyl ester cyclase
MKLLIVAPSSADLYQDLSKDLSAKEPNLWAGLLANSVRSKCDVSIYDMEVNRPTAAEFYSDVESISPDLVLFVATGSNPNASSSAMHGATKAAECIRGLCKIAFIGPHVNALPIEVLQKHDFIDITFMNEGVYALRNIVERGTSIEALSSVKGIVYRDDAIKMNMAEGIVPQNLMEFDMPGVAYDLMPSLDNYRTSTWHTNFKGNTSPFASIYTSLGCYSKCSFCMINSINRTSIDFTKTADSFNIFRYWSPEYTIKQLEYLSSQGVTNLKIADEMFVYRPKHFMTLCELIIERGLKFNIWAYSRVDTAKPQYLETLKKAGVNHLALGIESASQTVRQEIDKGRFKEVNIRDIVKSINDHGIGVGGNFIVGLPTDDFDSMEESYQLAVDLPLANMNIYCATALPGSPLYLQAKNEGRRVPEEYSEFGFLSYNHVPDCTKYLSASDVLRFRDDFFHRYFTNESVLKRMGEAYGEVAVSNIKEMTKIKLKRKLLKD